MSQLRLRCRTSTGRQLTLDQLSCDSLVSDLADRIYALADIGRDHELLVKFGYPPKPLDLVSSASSSLCSLGIANGESLIVEWRRSEAWRQEKAAQLDADLCATAAVGSGFLTVQPIPANNSCLFLAIDYCANGKLNLDSPGSMRAGIVRAVSGDPAKFTEAFLDKANPEYCRWILTDAAWGGAIELSILCQQLGLQINVVDTQTGRIDEYPCELATEKVYLIYDGIHYDSVAMEMMGEDESGRLVTRFPVGDENVHRMANDLGREAKSAGMFTDVSKFQLRCADCMVYLRGEAEARQHAKQTGHANFRETRGS